MSKPALKLTALAMAAFACVVTVKADTLINNFDTSFDYLANGIVGDTNWDGVYLGFGDIQNGGAGGSGNGASLIANANVQFPSFLTARTTRTDWSGTGDDSFFLWKLVSGDFDVQVESFPPWAAVANHFGGLMVRAYNTNNSGAPVSFNSTNASENWLALFRCQQFGAAAPTNGIGEIRQATNAANFENTWADLQNPGTNETRFYRITRTGDLFKFYWKTNSGDDWFLITNASAGGGYVATNGGVIRSDWAGLPVQVGIAEAMFSGNQAESYYTGFQLSGTNVTFPILPTPPSNVTISSPNPNGSVNVSWTPGAGSAGSLVLVRANGRLISQPVNGITYAAASNFANSNTLLSAANSHVVYTGTGSSVTVSGLGGTNNTYDIAVFSYSGSGSSIVYNNAAPATNRFIGPGQVSAVSFTLSPSNIPINGAAVATVTATYTSGDSYDVSSDPNTIWLSSNPNVAVATNGVVTGVTNGSTVISAVYAGATGTNGVTVHVPAFKDEFSVNRNYLTNGVVGSPWDGIYLGAGDVPFQIAANLGAGAGVVSNCDANITTNNALTVVHRQTGWEGNENDGFFLFKKVPGDFQVAVHIDAYQNLAFQFPGLMARLATANGGPAGTTNATFLNGREDHVRWMRFDEFGISTSARRNLNGANQVVDSTDSDTTAFWLLMVRQGTNFTLFKRTGDTDPWTAVPGSTRVLADATNGAAMQVGLGASTFDSGVNLRSVTFSHFMLDGTNVNLTGTPPSPASAPSFISNPDGSLTLSWVNGAGSVGNVVVMRASKPVNVVPQFGVTYTGNSSFGLGSDLGSSNYVVYVGSGTSVTVSGLIPGTDYYAAVFSYSGAGATTSYNVLGSTQGKATAIGAVQSITFGLPQGSRLVNGGILPFTSYAIYLGGVSNDISGQVAISAQPTGAIAGTNGVLTGLSNGPVLVTLSFSGKTNAQTVTVVSPKYADNFGVSHDYNVAGVGGTIWDGIYRNAGDLPGATGGGANGATPVCDANISSNNVLTVVHSDTEWAGGADDGFLLFRYVAGDFQAAVHMNSETRIAFQFSGLMARAFGNTNSMLGTPYNGSENWVYYGQFEQFNDSTESRHALNGADNELPNFDGTTNDFSLLIVRKGGVFNFYRRVNPTDPWEFQPGQTITRADLAGVPLQVGLFAAMYTANPGTVQFDSFMLDETLPAIQATSSGGNLTLNWPAAPSIVLQSTSSLNSPNWVNVGGTPGTTNGVATLTVPIGSSRMFFRLAR